MHPGDEVKEDPRSSLPAVGRLADVLAKSWPDLPAWARVEGARRAVAAARRDLDTDPGAEPPALEALEAQAARLAAGLCRPRPGRVINATGVVLHTNLGRAVLGAEAAAAVSAAAARRFASDASPRRSVSGLEPAVAHRSASPSRARAHT